MDTITQAVLGAAIAEAGWRKDLGKKAIWMGIIGGLLPDLDILAAAVDPWAEVMYHRGFTHSLFFAPLVAPILGWFGWKWSKQQGTYKQWTHLLFWAVLTHPLLDICTTYGTQFLLPLSNKRFALDAIAVIDPLYTLPLMLALWLAKRNKAHPMFGRRLTQFMLVLTTAYLGLGYYQSQRAVQYTKEHFAQSNNKKKHVFKQSPTTKTVASSTTKSLPHSHQPKAFVASEIRATPTLFSIWLWRVLVKNKEGDMRVGLVSTLRPQPSYFHVLNNIKHPLIDKTRQHPKAKLMKWFAMDMLSPRLEKKGDRTIVYLDDQRFGSLSEPQFSLWGVRAEYGKNNKLIRVDKHQRSRTKININKEFTVLWQGIFGK